MSSHNRYQEFEMLMATALISAAVIFVLYLLIASAGIVWLKWVLAILDIALCAGGFGILLHSGELLRPRSLWLSCGFFAVLACLLVSLNLNYPG